MLLWALTSSAMIMNCCKVSTRPRHEVSSYQREISRGKPGNNDILLRRSVACIAAIVVTADTKLFNGTSRATVYEVNKKLPEPKLSHGFS